jgi:hypothetical protein
MNVLSSSILVWFHFIGPAAWGRISSTGAAEYRQMKKCKKRINKEMLIIKILSI